MESKISVIIPVYNVERYLEKCVNSVINQTYKNLEIILVNDGSTDNSGKLCDEIASKDSRIKVIHKENGGLSSARNKGIEEATSDYIGFIDSDDYIDLDMYEELYNNLLKENADVSMCGHYDIYPKYSEKQVSEETVYLLNSEEAIEMVMEAKVLSVTAVNKLYKKYLFNDLKFELGKIAEDAFIMIKLLSKCKKIVATNKKKYYYVHRENSITTQKFSLKYMDVIEAYEQNSELIMKNYPELEYQAITRLCWAYFFVLDKLLVDDTYKDKLLEKKLISYLKKNKKFILENRLFTRNRKIGFICLLISKKLYRKILSKKD